MSVAPPDPAAGEVLTMQGFAVVPDHHRQAVATFVDLEDALEWALANYGSDRFAVRYLELALCGRPVAGAT